VSRSSLALTLIILVANSSCNFTISFSTAERRCSSCALCTLQEQHDSFPDW
jgi:hypothetical protein